MTIHKILSRLQGVKKIAGGWEALCPAHDDENASLCVSEGNDGRILLCCHAKCTTEAVVAAMNLKMTDLFVPKAKPELVETYDYTDTEDKLLYQICRFSPKDFRQRRPDPEHPDKWLWNMNGIDRVLYRLPDIVAAKALNRVVFVVEGEKDASAIKGLGLCATTAPGGAGKWLPQYTKSLIGAIVYIIPDKDKPGREYASQVATALNGKAKLIKIVELPDRNGHKVKDAYDYFITNSGTIEELREIASKTPYWKPEESKPESVEEFYYDKNQKEYLLRNKREVWLALTEAQFKKELARRGFRTRTERGENVSEADEFIMDLRDTQDVDYVGPLAGYPTGIYEILGNRILVTKQPSIIEPAAGKWETIDAVISGLLFDEKHDQRDYLFGWLKIAYDSVRSKHYRPGQALALCGPHNCGKSLIQQIITVILGGRSAKPYDYMVDSTNFNSEMFKAEHLCIEDEAASTDIRARRAFGAQIKQITACDTQRCHKKHCEAITLSPFWRLSISINDEPENLMVLPPIDNSIEDKLIILRSTSFPMPMPSETSEERAAFWAQLMAEVPAFLDYLVNWNIPQKLRSQRYGVAHWHHPDLLSEIDSFAPEYRLLTIIDRVLFGGELSLTWTGSAEDLQIKLTADNDYSYDARKLLSWSNAAGTYLGRLAKKHPGRFSLTRTQTSRSWTIEPPREETDNSPNAV